MQVLLISTYDMGRQPFGLASPAAWLRGAGHTVVQCDLSVSALPEEAVRTARLAAFHLPMHTATRLAARAIGAVRRLNPEIHLCCYGLYAPVNADYLRDLGVQSILGGEFEAALVSLAGELAAGAPPAPRNPVTVLDRLRFQVPDRSDLPAAEAYAHLRHGDGTFRLAGYTEASRGCKHLCRHCPVVPVYNGAFRVVQPGVVLADVRQQVAAGAEHISFGDPDFFNGPTHARRIMEAMHGEFPAVSYDVTIKIEHLRKHRDLISVLKDTGCLFVTTAVESIDDDVLEKLDKGHTRADFIRVVEDFRRLDFTLEPTFIPFTPWTTVERYRALLALLRELDLIENVSPVQLALRLLIPSGSRLLELQEIRDFVQGFDAAALLHRWRHPDPEVDLMAAAALKIAARKQTRHELFQAFWELAHDAPMPEEFDLIPRAAIPYMNEPWYC